MSGTPGMTYCRQNLQNVFMIFRVWYAISFVNILISYIYVDFWRDFFTKYFQSHFYHCIFERKHFDYCNISYISILSFICGNYLFFANIFPCKIFLYTIFSRFLFIFIYWQGFLDLSSDRLTVDEDKGNLIFAYFTK